MKFSKGYHLLSCVRVSFRHCVYFKRDERLSTQIVDGVLTRSVAANFLLNRQTFQSAEIESGGKSSNAVDGNYNSDRTVPGSSCTHTKEIWQAWWAVDMGEDITIMTVTITNRLGFGK